MKIQQAASKVTITEIKRESDKSYRYTRALGSFSDEVMLDLIILQIKQ